MWFQMMPYQRIKRVIKEQEFGCAVACLAMVTDKTYWDVAESFSIDFTRKGMPRPEMMQWLADAGFAIILKEVQFYNHVNDARDEMLKPFALVHIVSLKQYVDSKLNHAVVMDSKGKLIDSDPKITDKIMRSVHYVQWVIGLYR